MHRSLPAIFGLLFALISLCPLTFFAYRLFRDIEVWTRFQPARCVVVSSDTREMRSAAGTRGQPRYTPTVVLDCQISGRTVRTTATDTWGESGASGWQTVEKMLRGFQPGMTVTAWHHPTKPARAVFTRKVNHRYLMIVIPLIMLIGGLAAFRHFLKSAQVPEQPEQQPYFRRR